MRQLTGSDSGIPQSGRPTRGTETSKYPQEEKVNTIPPVVASERGRAQTGAVAKRPRGYRTVREAIEEAHSRIRWKAEPQEVRAP